MQPPKLKTQKFDKKRIPFGSATSACSSLGRCLNLAFPQCMHAAQILYIANFSSGAKPNVLAASWKREQQLCIRLKYDVT